MACKPVDHFVGVNKMVYRCRTETPFACISVPRQAQLIEYQRQQNNVRQLRIINPNVYTYKKAADNSLRLFQFLMYMMTDKIIVSEKYLPYLSASPQSSDYEHDKGWQMIRRTRTLPALSVIPNYASTSSGGLWPPQQCAVGKWLWLKFYRTAIIENT